MTKAEAFEQEVLSTLRGYGRRSIAQLSTIMDKPGGSIRSVIDRLIDQDLVGSDRAGPEDDAELQRTQSVYWALTKDEILTIRRTKDPLLDQVVNEVIELRKFKEMAIKVRPELNVSSNLLEARKRVAELADDGEDRHEILSGGYDTTPAMLALLQLMESLPKAA